jgi:V8-like Glu-specific endopeptidase
LVGRVRWLGLALGLALLSHAAGAEPLAPRMIPDDEAPAWTAVGPLNVAGNRSCTATLISPTEAITAAHCLFHPITHHRADPADIKFVLGQRRDTYAAIRGVARTAVLPDYVYIGPHVGLEQVGSDMALLELDQPVPPEVASPLKVVEWPLPGAKGAGVSVMGYGRDRPYMATMRSGCLVTETQSAIGQIDCPLLPGLSGAPVLLDSGRSQQLLAVVSSIVGTRVNPKASLILSIAPHLAELRALLQ